MNRLRLSHRGEDCFYLPPGFAGWLHSLALDINSFIWAWGNNYYGQLQKFPHF
jgi:hypothetical protein